MQIIVVYFLYHVCLKKAIVQVVLKIKSVDCTNVLVFHYFFIKSGSLFLLAKWLSFLLTKANIRRKHYFLYYKGRRYIVLMQIIVVYFLYHVCPEKAIAQAVLKIKSAFYTNAQTFHW